MTTAYERLRNALPLTRPDPIAPICDVYQADLSLALKAIDAMQNYFDAPSPLNRRKRHVAMFEALTALDNTQ